jgi:hypothetical protein
VLEDIECSNDIHLGGEGEVPCIHLHVCCVREA